MGKPIKVMLNGQPVFVCCKSCVKQAQEDPAKTLRRVEELRTKRAAADDLDAKVKERIRRALAELPPADRALAEAQQFCPVTDQVLGSMGKPVKVTIKGQTVFVCCPECDQQALEKPDETLRKVEEFKKRATSKK